MDKLQGVITLDSAASHHSLVTVPSLEELSNLSLTVLPHVGGFLALLGSDLSENLMTPPSLNLVRESHTLPSFFSWGPWILWCALVKMSYLS